MAGGAAHSFARDGFTFDSGPSFHFGLQDAPGTSVNGLVQALDMLRCPPVPCASYDRWRVHHEGGIFDCSTSLAEYERAIEGNAGATGLEQWRRLYARLLPLASFAASLPFASLRGDASVALSVARFLPSLAGGMAGLAAGPGGLAGSLSALQGSFGDLLVAEGVTNPWLLALLDLECFVISGCLAGATPAPEMAYIVAERFKKGAVLDFPYGGSGALVDALVAGIARRGGRVELRAPVSSLIMDAAGRACGVELAGGRGRVLARTAVVSSLSAWDHPRLLPPASPAAVAAAAAAAATPECGSFIHLHLGFDAAGLDLAAIGIHHLVVSDWYATARDRNVINICIASALDPSLAPPGCAVAHVYGAANESYDDWAGLKRGSAEYNALKEERSQVLWAALERVIPDIRSRAKLTLVGTPLTHARYLRRHRGSYGPALGANPAAWPGPVTDVPGLLRCGDSCFPGIGVPAAAASGLIAANTILPIAAHWKLLDTRR